jgi:antitoxin PrlF
MAIARSKLTRQGQISVPAEVRRRLGLDPGAILEWDESGGEIVVRKSGRYSSVEIHDAVFGDDVVTRRSPEEIEEGIRRHIRKRHARG